MTWSRKIQCYIGYLPRESPACWEPLPSRLGILEVALMDLERKIVNARVLRAVVAHFAHWALLWRSSLSAPHACFSLLKRLSELFGSLAVG